MKRLITTLLIISTCLSFVYSQQVDTIIYAQGSRTIKAALPAYTIKNSTFYSYIDFINPGYTRFDKPTYLTKVMSTGPGIITITLESNVEVKLLSTGVQDFMFLPYNLYCDIDYLKRFRVISIESTTQTGIAYLRAQ